MSSSGDRTSVEVDPYFLYSILSFEKGMFTISTRARNPAIFM